MSIDELCTACLPPPLPRFVGTADAWRRVEEKMQINFPEDYKQCIDRYGAGEFGEFMCVLNPHFDAPGYSYFNHIQEILAAYAALASIAPDKLPFACYPAKGGLLPAATTSNGDVIYWATEGEPNNWPLVVYATRHWQYERFNFGIVKLIAGMLLGSSQSDILPEDLPTKFAP